MNCCFTGPRTYKLNFKYGEKDPLCIELKNKLKIEIKRAIESGYTDFLSGMAMGVDIFSAEIVLDLKKIYTDIKLHSIIPFKNQASKWNKSDILRYNNILKNADSHIILQEFYSPDCFYKRNKYMIDKSRLVIAVYNGGGGGTKHTLDYALKKNIDIRLITL